MNIYQKWKKIQIHFIVIAVIFILVPCFKFIFTDSAYEVFYAFYLISSIAITISCIMVNVKHGFLWYYPFCIMFAVTITMLIFFAHEIQTGIITVFFSHISNSFVTTIIGGIVHKIRENNKEE